MVCVQVYEKHANQLSKVVHKCVSWYMRTRHGCVGFRLGLCPGLLNGYVGFHLGMCRVGAVVPDLGFTYVCVVV